MCAAIQGISAKFGICFLPRAERGPIAHARVAVEMTLVGFAMVNNSLYIDEAIEEPAAAHAATAGL